MAYWDSVPRLKEEHWEQEVAAHAVAVVLFWAAWSQPDHMMSGVLEAVRPEFASIAFFSCDLDSAPEVAAANAVMTNPTLICFLNGQRHVTTIGYLGEEHLRARLSEWLAAGTST